MIIISTYTKINREWTNLLLILLYRDILRLMWFFVAVSLPSCRYILEIYYHFLSFKRNLITKIFSITRFFFSCCLFPMLETMLNMKIILFFEEVPCGDFCQIFDIYFHELRGIEA